MRGYNRDRAFIQINTDDGESGSTEQARSHRAGEDEFQMPAHGSSSFAGELTRRSNRDRHCRQFNSEQGCPNGDSCNFLHDEKSRNRKSEAITLSQSGYSGRGSGRGGGGRGSGSAGVGGGTSGSGGNAATAGNGANSKPFDWKTIPCNNLQMTAYCPFGNKCDFGHGATELQRYGGGLMVGERRDSGSAIVTGKIQEVPSQRPSNGIQRPSSATQRPSIARPSNATQRLGQRPSIANPSNAIQRPGQRPSIARPSTATQRSGQRTRSKWPKKLNGIYGDWINDSI